MDSRYGKVWHLRKNRRGKRVPTGQFPSVVSAFTEEQVNRLTGVTIAQLRYWHRTRFFVPSVAAERRRRHYNRIYSFRDIVCLKILNVIRNESEVSLPHLREVKEKLAHLGDDMWAKTTLYVLNKKVIFVNPQTQKREEIVSGQQILEIPLQIVQADMQKAVRELWRRQNTTVGKIQKKRGIVGKRAVIAGTRIPVSAIKAFQEEGYTIKQIMQQYPVLTEDDVKAALAYGSKAA